MTTEMAPSNRRLIEALEDPTAFRDWLSGGDPGREVGIRQAESRCPIASFLSQRFSLADVHVCCLHLYTGYSNSWDGFDQAPPLWAQCFIRRIDEKGDGPVPAPVLASEALDVLNGCIVEGADAGPQVG
jgi:hypothetical protein